MRVIDKKKSFIGSSKLLERVDIIANVSDVGAFTYRNIRKTTRYIP